MEKEKLNLNPDVAKKYKCLFTLTGGECAFPNAFAKHGIGPKPLHLLTAQEVDTLVAHDAVKGVFELLPSGKEK